MDLERKMKFDETQFKQTLAKKDLEFRETAAKLEIKEEQYLEAMSDLRKALSDVEGMKIRVKKIKMRKGK